MTHGSVVRLIPILALLTGCTNFGAVRSAIRSRSAHCRWFVTVLCIGTLSVLHVHALTAAPVGPSFDAATQVADGDSIPSKQGPRLQVDPNSIVVRTTSRVTSPREIPVGLAPDLSDAPSSLGTAAGLVAIGFIVVTIATVVLVAYSLGHEGT